MENENLLAVEFPTLYKKTSTGAMQYWIIYVQVNLIVTRFGQVGGKEQRTNELIKEGKNKGKKNETSASQQAVLEAKARWEKQVKKGYVADRLRAEIGEDDVVGGVLPMLAHKFSEQAHKIKYPAYLQPKLDGIRCIAILKGGKCTLWSRTRKPITGVPHIQREIEANFPNPDLNLVLDGELYNHSFKKDFEKIVSYVRQETPAPGHEVVEYHVYDQVSDLPFSERTEWLEKVLVFPDGEDSMKYVKLVNTYPVNKEEEILDFFNIFMSQGFEGAMVRNHSGLYVNKRSYDLLKVKEFDEAEFKIIGVGEGRGKLAGHAATFICEMANGQTFEAKLKGDTEMLRTYFENHSLWTGKKLTVQYQGLTGKNKVPRFPVGKAVRDYE